MQTKETLGGWGGRGAGPHSREKAPNSFVIFFRLSVRLFRCPSLSSKGGIP